MVGGKKNKPPLFDGDPLQGPSKMKEVYDDQWGVWMMIDDDDDDDDDE